MKIDILTLFPDMFEGVFDHSIIKIARRKDIVSMDIHNLRDWTYDNHRTVDDKPFGGGSGMVLKIEPIHRALNKLKKNIGSATNLKIILLTPQGHKYAQKDAKELSVLDHLILICGHYEGFDERIRTLVDLEISVGDYVLSCGEIPAMAVCDSVIRLIPGVLGSEESLEEESFNNNGLEYPQYTRPSIYKEMKVPEVLLSGNAAKIKKWKEEESYKRTKLRRPDLLNKEERR